MSESKTPSLWSANLQIQTRSAIDGLCVGMDGKLHFKHKALGFGYANILDLFGPVWVIHGKTNSVEWRFGSVDAIISAGWAID